MRHDGTIRGHLEIRDLFHRDEILMWKRFLGMDHETDLRKKATENRKKHPFHMIILQQSIHRSAICLIATDRFNRS